MLHYRNWETKFQNTKVLATSLASVVILPQDEGAFWKNQQKVKSHKKNKLTLVQKNPIEIENLRLRNFTNSGRHLQRSQNMNTAEIINRQFCHE